MTLPVSRINLFRAAVTATIGAAMPELRECAAQFGRFNLDELETTMIRAPAVRVAVLSAKAPRVASGQAEARLSCAAFVVTDGKDRDIQAWTIAEALATLLHAGQMFGLLRLGGPSAVAVQPVATMTLKQRGVSIIAVEWTQELRELGAGLFDDEMRLLPELYVNEDELAIGDA